MGTPVFDVSGQDGQAGASGVDYSRATARVGYHGRDGGDGAPGADGTPAGNITLQLLTPRSTATLPHNVVLAEPSGGDVQVETELVYSNSNSSRLDTILEVGAGELIWLKAIGGNGGHGGDGGGGERGGAGLSGRDASRFQSAEHGGPGGNGGNGGDAGAGGDGASGGAIRIGVTKEDTYLLMLFGKAIYNGGSGAPPGTPGEGGRGGCGGRGGSSYTYSVTNGNVTTWYTKSAGDSGADGWSGSRGAFAKAGMDARDGTFNIAVADSRGTSSHDKIFDLSLLDVKLVPEKEDGVIEPGGRVFVSSLDISNIGGMPTPISRSALAYIKPEHSLPPTLAGENWVISEGFGRYVQLPRGLEPGRAASVLCTSFANKADGKISPALNSAGEYLAFGVAPVNPILALSSHPQRHQRGEPFRVTAPLLVRAQMTPFGRDFESFVRQMPFNICYPVQMSEIASLASLPPGGQTLVKFSVTNISQKDYGEDGEMGRRIILKIVYEDGDADPAQFTFIPILNGAPMDPIVFRQSEKDAQLFSDGRFVRTINLLPAGTTVNIAGWLTVTRQVEPYTAARFSVELLLGEIDNPSNVVPIQRRDVNVRLSKVYKKTPGSRTLLITNNQTTQVEIKAWEQLAWSIFGANVSAVVDIWDVSQEGHFDLNRVLPSGSTLFNDWQNCTVVILDNFYDNSATRKAHQLDDCALNYLNQDQLATAVLSHGMHFCVVSPVHESSTAQRQHLATPRKGLMFTSSNAFEPLRGLLNPFATAANSFVVYGNAADFVEAEIDVNVDGTPMPKSFSAPWARKPVPPIHQIHLDGMTAQIPSSVLYLHVEHIVLVHRKKPFKSLKKVHKLAASLQKQLLRKHPERRYAMSVCHPEDLQDLATQAQFVLPNKTQAAIRIRRSMDVSSLSSRITLTAAPASPVDTMALTRGAATIHTPAFINSPQIVSAFLHSIPFPHRVYLYAGALRSLDGSSGSGNEVWRAGTLRASLLADLACEQATLRLKKRNHGVGEGSIMLLLPRLTALSQINLPPMPVDCVGRNHLLDLLATLTAYMETQFAWYQKLLLNRRCRQVTEISNTIINSLTSRVFSTGSPTNKQVKTASSKVLKQWKTDVARVRKTNNPHKPVISLKGRALAGVLGSVAGGKIEWCEEDHANSVAGSICTEFGIFFTPESFLADGPNGGGTSGLLTKGKIATTLDSGFGSVTRNVDARKIFSSATVRKNTIVSRMTANHNATLELAFAPPVQVGN